MRLEIRRGGHVIARLEDVDGELLVLAIHDALTSASLRSSQTSLEPPPGTMPSLGVDKARGVHPSSKPVHAAFGTRASRQRAGHGR